MSAVPEVLVEPTEEALAGSVALRAVELLADAIASRGAASVVLTGGGILEKVFTQLAEDPGSAAVDWSRVDVYWGDERFVAADSPDRNDGPVQRLLLDRLPFDPSRVHAMPSTDGPDHDDLDAAARRYSDVLADAAGRNTTGDDPDGDPGVPNFDVVLLGVGPDGHCCSLFPDQPGPLEHELSVIGVRNSPKPPPNRISLTFRSLAAAEEVWVIASGTGKADAVAKALGGASPQKIPSAGAAGRRRTLWLLDEAAASNLPETAITTREDSGRPPAG